MPYKQKSTLKLGQLDDAAKQVFRNGHCHSLALALNERTDWQLMITLETRPETPEPIVDPLVLASLWSHALVRTPWNTYVDVEGETDWLEGWSDIIIPVQRSFLENIHHYHGGVKPNIRIARHFVDPVLALMRKS